MLSSAVDIDSNTHYRLSRSGALLKLESELIKKKEKGTSLHFSNLPLFVHLFHFLLSSSHSQAHHLQLIILEYTKIKLPSIQYRKKQKKKTILLSKTWQTSGSSIIIVKSAII